MDNWAVPNLQRVHLSFVRQISDIDFLSNSKTNKSLHYRIAPDVKNTYPEQCVGKKGDLLFCEIGWADVIATIKNERFNFSFDSAEGIDKYWDRPLSDLRTDMGVDVHSTFFKLISDAKFKSGVILNIPNIHQFPAFNLIKKVDIDKVASLAQTTEIYIAGGAAHLTNVGSFSPTTEVDSLLSSKVHILLKKGLNEKNPLGILSLGPNQDASNEMIVRYNEYLNYYAKKVKFSLVDINSLYEKILKGGFVTDDGVRVDASFPTGNFFSIDGIYPTALGQAVVANEVIKTINSNYKTAIPLVPTREYLSIK